MHVVVDETRENSFPTPVDDTRPLGQVHFSHSYPLDAITFNKNGRMLDGLASIAVDKSATLDHNWHLLCFHVYSPAVPD